MIQSRQIEAFRAVMRTGAMTAAAESIHVTQPAVSRLIRDLEQDIGFSLFHRRGNMVVPTSEAQALLAEVERSFTGLERIQQFAVDLRTGRGGELKIAGFPAVAFGFLPRFVAQFCKDRPHISVLFETFSSNDVRERVLAGQFEIGVTAFPFQRNSLAATPIYDKAVVVAPAGHRFRTQKAVRIDDLKDEHLILLGRFRNGRHPIEVKLQSVAHRVSVETSMSSVACLLAAEGAGVTVVDPYTASEFADRGLVVRPLVPSLVIGSAIVFARDRELSIAARDFHDSFFSHVADFLHGANG
ncbi:LysR family transcriptional regulator [Acidisphaera sp. L21]|uniref:LysR family transcriptional regulator n=1 Tax=Acidisphaera sp. L21 TaxID=1641851 RepID=UPI00131C8857|nr:LysR family transcriptional regulator [Acidisphaera sp. L21]